MACRPTSALAYARAQETEPQLAMGASAALQLPALPTKRRRRAPRRSPPQPMHWGAPPFLGQMPPPSSLMHYPGHWASTPVMPPPAPVYVSPTGPRHSDIVAAHNRASRLGERRDVRSPPHERLAYAGAQETGDSEFPLGRFFDLTMPIRREDREAFEAQLTLYAAENGFAGEPELRQMIEALRAAVIRHNASFQMVWLIPSHKTFYRLIL